MDNPSDLNQNLMKKYYFKIQHAYSFHVFKESVSSYL